MKEKCKNCTAPSKECIAYLMTLTTKETLEWCLMWKARLGWSNATLAERAKVPKGTIDRNLSPAKLLDDAAGVKLATIRPVICAITGCTWEELESCEGLPRFEIDALTKENETLKKQVDFLKNQIKFKESQMEAKDKQLEERHEYIMSSEKRKNRIIAILAFSLAATLLLIIAALVIDRLNPEMGFLWIDRMSAMLHGELGAAGQGVTNNFL